MARLKGPKTVLPEGIICTFEPKNNKPVWFYIIFFLEFEIINEEQYHGNKNQKIRLDNLYFKKTY